ncbi:major facilitator superfamily transporter, putative [Entamoeba histolytica HM-3:IMSS]|uniref:Major facilitator superfamily protein n=6 Tax=Entamoeba histolytica TaxID=5759 RepID=C4LVS9_ENTH1|nr:major facilitator superfamily transporter [Entamoeba histolytica HM-1:IMSS]EMD47810.1 major facilitator superfamily transporter, putative [Entamoeba histolytica KU27]EMS10775.1 major facilitator superfamily transporter, putative [Entamoeba histolytica HM-3:IMSS]ENY63745.1 major facilitator superfamily transporter, putative [Entamoeba histolytica HM-1:IMSS-A]GAT92785.1 major facilitator superfamily protein [Entamoeba histolytica]EAL51090.1 major facilitator superfamily protein [Entamoeba his|eukprot:XP_656474.1 major facilitator superfamily transporter [Entamoeba histolytica HM-1:IMSS]
MAITCKTILKNCGKIFWNFPRACLTGFLFNFANYFYWLVVPLIMNDKGGSTFDLSLLQTVGFIIYAVLTPICGKIGDKFNPYIVIRIAFVFFIIAVAVILIWPSSIAALYVSVCIWPFCTGFFWPVTTGTIGLEAPLGHENRNTSLYQVCWSVGKAFGFLFGGMLKSALGINSLYICIGLVLINMIVYPFSHPKRVREKLKKLKEDKKKNKKEKEDIAVDVDVIKKTEEQPNKSVEIEMTKEEPADIQVPKDLVETPKQSIELPRNEKPIKIKWTKEEFNNKTFIYLGYIMQCGIYGTSAVLSNMYVKLAQDQDVNTPTKGIDMYIGIIFFFYFLAQTLVMVLMSLTMIWTYKRIFFLIFQLFYIIMLIVFAVSRNAYVNWFLAFVGGLAGGFAYQTSTYYSMRASESSKSMFMGISECVSGLGNSLLPLVSGLLCTYLNNNYVQIYISIVCILLCLILEEIVYHVGMFINGRRQAKRADPTNQDFHYEHPEQSQGHEVQQSQEPDGHDNDQSDKE